MAPAGGAEARPASQQPVAGQGAERHAPVESTCGSPQVSPCTPAIATAPAQLSLSVGSFGSTHEMLSRAQRRNALCAQDCLQLSPENLWGSGVLGILR